MVKISRENQELVELYEDFKELYQDVIKEGQDLYQSWQPDDIREDFRPDAENLAHYVALRRHQLTDLQRKLQDWGLSSLGRSEGQVLATLETVLASLARLANIDNPVAYPEESLANSRGQERLQAHKEEFFGPQPEGYYPHIMVTIPSEAAEDYQLVVDLVKNGMNVARINCAHDGSEVWTKIIKHIQKAEKELNQEVKLYFDIAGPKVRIDAIYSTLQNPRVSTGDSLFLTYQKQLEAFYGQEIVLSCEIEDLIKDLKIGETVNFDDGKIIGKIEETFPEGALIRLTQLQKEKVRIKATKGINFPDRKLDLPILAKKDYNDLDFAKDYADVIGFSFISDAEDIILINDAMLQAYDQQSNEIPIVLKAETKGGFENLVDIIIEANRHRPAGIMIARGDLAVEVGYIRLSEIQEEILWFGEAARVPVIWATQVLESLAKTGVPTRAEISDASMSAGADCVMLNKGPYINDVLELLTAILATKGRHQFKKTPFLKSLNVAK